ncbi:MAG: helix-turn-helix transcriptional regulator [Aeriscardovia sp.]|nr:helix-turn-helix transcriptional regulator [Aeriscardovia sp.]
MGKADNAAGFSGEKLKEAMRQKKISNGDLAEAIGVPRETIGRWRTKNVTPSQKNLLALAEFFDVTINYFYKGTTTDVDEAILYERENIIESAYDELRKSATLYSLFEEDYLSINNPEVVHLVAYLRSCGYEVDYLAKVKKMAKSTVPIADKIKAVDKKISDAKAELYTLKDKLRDREYEKIQLELIKAIQDTGRSSYVVSQIGKSEANRIIISAKMNRIIAIYKNVMKDLGDESVKTKDTEDTRKRILDEMTKHEEYPLGYRYILEVALHHLRGNHWDVYRNDIPKIKKINIHTQLRVLDSIVDEGIKKADPVLTHYADIRSTWEKSKDEVTFDDSRYKKEYKDIHSKLLITKYDKKLDYYYGLLSEKDYLVLSTPKTENFFMKDYRNLSQVLEALGYSEKGITGITDKMDFAVRIRKDGEDILLKLPDLINKSCSSIPRMLIDELKTIEKN